VINIYCYDPEIVAQVYPELTVVREGDYVGHGQLFIGRGQPFGEPDAYQVTRVLNQQTEISLPDRWKVVEKAHERKGKRIPKSLQKYVERMDPEEFITELRYFMACTKWVKLSSMEAKIYMLFDALTQSRDSFMKQYFALRQTYSYQEIWASVVTFFLRVVNYDSTDTNISDFYKKVIERFKNQSSKIRSALTFFNTNVYNEVTVVMFFLSVR